MRPSTTPKRIGATRSKHYRQSRPNVIFDPVGGEGVAAAFRSIAWRGRHLVVGSPPAPSGAGVQLPGCSKGARCSASISPRSRNRRRKRTPADCSIVRWLASGNPQPGCRKVVPSRIFARRSRPCSRAPALGKMIVKLPRADKAAPRCRAGLRPARLSEMRNDLAKGAV